MFILRELAAVFSNQLSNTNPPIAFRKSGPKIGAERLDRFWDIAGRLGAILPEGNDTITLTFVKRNFVVS